MTDHYFSETPISLSRPEIYHDELRGIEFKMWTDHGVFSRGHTDKGSREMILAMDVAGAEKVLDLGCGYGVIGILAAKLNPTAHIILTDPNERAITLARRNLESNGVHNCEIRQGENLTPVAGELFDVILTNPPIRTGNALVFTLIAESTAHLVPGGRFYLVARTKQGAKTFAAEMARNLSEVTQVGQGSGFRVYRGIRK